MILETFRCDRCEEETPVLEPGEPPWGWVLMDSPCPEHGVHEYHCCGWTCAMHLAAEQLDHQEAHEAEINDEAE